MKFIPLALCVALLAGCGSSYCWRSSVPADRRSVYVPTFRNESGLQEIGAISARQLLREIQREGTFRKNGERRTDLYTPLLRSNLRFVF